MEMHASAPFLFLMVLARRLLTGALEGSYHQHSELCGRRLEHMASSSAPSRVVIVSLMRQSLQSEACKGKYSLHWISADAVRTMACMECERTLSQTEFAVTVIQRMQS